VAERLGPPELRERLTAMLEVTRLLSRQLERNAAPFRALSDQRVEGGLDGAAA
jgi:hypothetical protein